MYFLIVLASLPSNHKLAVSFSQELNWQLDFGQDGKSQGGETHYHLAILKIYSVAMCP